MSKFRECDICHKKFTADEKVQIIRIQQFIEDDKIPEESNPDMVKKDACQICAELHSFAWDNFDNIKAMFTSIKLRKAKLGKPHQKKPA